MERSVSRSYHEEVDPTLSFFSHPRTITLLIALLVGLLYSAMRSDGKSATTEDNALRGILAMAGAFLLIGVVLFRDGPFMRPHPAVWRVVLGLAVLYQMFMVFLLFQTVDDGRHLMTYLDPTLGIELPERSYAENCEFTPSNVWSQIDIFVLAHSLGWFGKALILRDVWICWIISVMFEIMEYSLEHQLPNFAECFYDHWFLDVLICNWLGIYVGMKTCEYFAVKQYSWRGFFEIQTYRGKIRRTAAQFTPASWTRFEWGATRSFKHFVAVIILVVGFLICELNAFYLKFLLWIPPEHPLVTYRLILMFLFGLPAVREFYDYLSDPNCKRIGAQLWLILAIILTEVIICIKWSRGLFTEPAPMFVKAFWVVFMTSLISYALWQFAYVPRRDKKKWLRETKNTAAAAAATRKQLTDTEAYSSGSEYATRTSTNGTTGEHHEVPKTPSHRYNLRNRH
ncbi:PSS-domain-containing protein [Ramicandelaber brevisporus]|nr:PSS-domain-containing protein [Ramicandelaber brevisporus]